ncbi:alanine--tRNA ligase [Candidatus Pelagibacterales bacterium]|nr:alanine--tRNA ligase [Pelagibacterales bacterium]
MGTKTLTECRSTFKNFFAKNSHQIVDSSPLVPQNDPTLMFTNSGMVQFKNVFTGLEKLPFKRATTSQKCVRAGGKHNDLENVGYTPRHHTFFEMLGNFSFGDYFKESAIKFAWELITKDYGISKEKLTVTVFHEDDEAFNLWKKIAGLHDSRIIRIKTNDNFWSMGDTGPCGPCSEIFYDHGEHLKGGPPGSVDQDGNRFVEIWNLVFMQFEQISKDKRVNLPKPSVDTGMGLERIAAVLQGTHDNYQIDLFKNIIKSAENYINIKVSEKNISSYRVIADHLRATAFLIADGVLPSNEGRGYVLRRIMRRAMRHAFTLGSDLPVLYKVLPTLISEMSSEYPELKRADSLISENLKLEEERFSIMLKNGMKILNTEIVNIKNNKLSGELAFKLYDTYGFPLDLTQDFLKDKKISVDEDQFNILMLESKKIARSSWKGSGSDQTSKIWFQLKEKCGPTEFLGYNSETSQGVILSIVNTDKEIDSSNKNLDLALILNQTIFYGESGGQVGDKGYISNNNFKFEVIDTKKMFGDLYIHYGKLISGEIKKGDQADLKIDSIKRQNIRANHSATHLLHESLRRTLGKHVTQKGSYVGPDRLRFDFSHNKPITDEEMIKINDCVNKIIEQKSDVQTRLMTPKAAVAEGALALFGEKYGEEVRVLTMGTDGNKAFSIELCGGTHVKNTHEIGRFSVVSQSPVAAGVRRVEALRDAQLAEHLKNRANEQDEISQSKIAQINDLEKKIKVLGGNIKETKEEDFSLRIVALKKFLEDLEVKNILLDKNKNIIKDINHNKISIRFQKLLDYPVKRIQNFIEEQKRQLNKKIMILYSINDGKVTVAVGITNDLINEYDASKLAKEIGVILGGKGGGGKKDFAQASGGSDASKIESSFEEILKKIN